MEDAAGRGDELMVALSVPAVEARLRSWQGRRVLVAGDLIADRYVFAIPTRLSREAPVIVATHERDTLVPGGGANALNNLRALGIEARPFGIVGDDESGRALIEALSELGLDTSMILIEPGHRTIAKTRFLVGDSDRTKQQLLRVDREPTSEVPRARRDQLRASMLEAVSSADGILLSDYGYGLVDPALLDRLRAAAPDLPITLDSRYALGAFWGMTLATPNLGELEAAAGGELRSDAEIAEAGRALRRRLGAQALLVTRGNQGMTLIEGEGRTRVWPVAGSIEVTDVSGAGDTVIAAATAALVGGASFDQAAWIANLAAGVTVTKVGAAVCTPEELLAAAEREA